MQAPGSVAESCLFFDSSTVNLLAASWQGRPREVVLFVTKGGCSEVEPRATSWINGHDG